MEERRPRLVITHLELENFKSYAGVQRIGPFHKSFSSVVGPNGSGKSNVIDSMLFVFGKRAKQLRLNKVSELIHSSTNFQNLEYARVSVYFQEIYEKEEDEFEIVPNSEMVVTRVAYRNNSSKYMIGDKTSTYTDVQKMLKAKGIDLDNNRFLILQGEVEQIAMMKPKAPSPHEDGLLEYLEDIIGSNSYIEKIEEEAKKLEELNQQRSGMIQRLKITEKERDGLEAAKAEAEAYIQKEQELFRWRSILFQQFTGQTQENLDKIQVSKSELETKLAHEREKFEEYNKSLEEMETRHSTCAKEHKKISKELEKADQEFKEYERKDIKYREDLKHAKQQAKKLEEKKAKAEKKLVDTEAEQKAFIKLVPELEARGVEMVEELKEADAAVEAKQATLTAEADVVRGELAEAQAALEPLAARQQEAQARVDVAAAERELLVEKAAAAKGRVKEAKAALKAAEDGIGATEGRIHRMEVELQAKKKLAAEQRKGEAAAAAAEEKMAEQVREVRGKVEEKRAALQAQQSNSTVMAGLMQAKASGEIPGIHGRLGDLGAIDAKYDVAISTSCGPLDNVVVEDTETAQQCVAFLRKHNLGVLTFLILDKQQHHSRAAAEQVSTPEGVPRLFDLVKCTDERMKLAFYYALRDTVVAEDLDQASRIAYGANKRFSRVVTVGGALIESSGTMSGGGGKPRGGRMRVGDKAPTLDAEASQDSVDHALRELDQAHGAMEGKAKEAAECGKAAAAAEKAVAELEMLLPKAHLELESFQRQVADTQRQISALEASADTTSEDASRLSDLEKEIAAAEKALKKCAAAAAGPAARVAELQHSLDNLGGDEFVALKKAAADLRQAIQSGAKEAAKKKAQITTADKAMERLRKEVADAEAAKEECVAGIAEKRKEFATLEEGALVVLEAFNTTKALLEEKTAELAALKEEHATMEASVNTIRTVEVDITTKLEELERSVKDNQAKARHWAAQLEEVRGHLQESLASWGAGAVHPAEGEEGAAAGELPPLLTPEELAQHTIDDSQVQVTMLEAALEKMKVNLESIAEWKAKDAEWAARMAEVDGVTADRDAVRAAHDALRKRRLDEFMGGFNAITLKLKEMYQMITLGGDAELELVDSLDPFSEGIVFSVRPPKKSWKNISNLSGGEKTLSSLALVFALHHYKPTPLYVMDEIDAALDFKNVSIVAHYIKERTKDAQFVIISLRNNMFELADRLVGIYKTDNTTKSVAINPGSFEVGAGTVVPVAL